VALGKVQCGFGSTFHSRNVFNSILEHDNKLMFVRVKSNVNHNSLRQYIIHAKFASLCSQPVTYPWCGLKRLYIELQ